MADHGTGTATAPPIARKRLLEISFSSVFAIFGFALLTAIAAQVRVPIPWTPVPATLQLLAVLFAGLILSPQASVTAMTLYLVCGAAGLPVFSPQNSGVLGPTGGYVIGFIAAAWVVSSVRGPSDATVLRLLVATACGTVVLFAFGAAGLYVWASASGLDPFPIVRGGTLPFLPKALVEIGLAVSLVAAIRRMKKKILVWTRLHFRIDFDNGI